jgi:hypothetical protein
MKVDRSLKRAPIGGYAKLSCDPASCRAGQMWCRLVASVVNRTAWFTGPVCTSLQRSRPGRIGSPAASADVQVSVRSLFDFSDHTALEPAVHRPSDSRVRRVS